MVRGVARGSRERNMAKGEGLNQKDKTQSGEKEERSSRDDSVGRKGGQLGEVEG